MVEQMFGERLDGSFSVAKSARFCVDLSHGSNLENWRLGIFDGNDCLGYT